MRLGSLCTGYGGLDLAVESLLPVQPVWLCEYDPAPAQVCEVRFPGVPNLHDLTALDWQQVPPVDVLTAGYPCQPFSHAGQRKGTDDARHLWPYIADAVRVLRPRLVILENVAGHLSLGFDVVLGDLADLGFNAEWTVLRASDIGACHQRARLFIVGANTDGGRWGSRPGELGGVGAAGLVANPPADADDLGHERGGSARRRGSGPADSGVAAADSDLGSGYGREPEPVGRQGGRTTAAGAGEDVHADTHGNRREGERWSVLAGSEPRSDADGRDGSGLPTWGDYEPAIRRHEHLAGRPSPAPTDDRGRLNPVFVEWMMCLPEGWVTDVLTSRTKALKCLGNGVVPPQAAYAIAGLLERLNDREVAA